MNPSSSTHRPKSWLLVTLGILITYSVLTVATALTQSPGIDEGYFANPAFNLVTKGSFSTTVLETFGTPFKGMDRHTYWIMPLHPLALSAAYRVFGFSVFSTRMISILWGLVALASWFVIVNSWFQRLSLSLLVVGLLSVDYVFIVCASSGRMDMMSAALGFAALATYLALRERNLILALLLSQSLVVTSGLTHPMGLLPFFGLTFVSVHLDRKRFRIKHVAMALTPYLIGAVAWGYYVAQDSSAFFSQFGGNAIMGSDENIGGRFVGLFSPITGLKLELTHRYLGNFGFGQSLSGVANFKIVLLAFYVIGVVGTLLIGELRRLANYRVLLGLTLIYFLGLSIIDSQKQYYYLIHIIPFYLALFALFVSWCWARAGLLFKSVLLPLSAVTLIGIGGLVHRIKQDNYSNSFKPAANFLEGRAHDHSDIAASSGVAFGLGFPNNIIHDPLLGYKTGRRFDYIVLDPEFAYSIKTSKERSPETYKYIMRLLSDEYDQIYDYHFYSIYSRKVNSTGQSD